jgi:uncharacterized protein (DUF1800 family)
MDQASAQAAARFGFGRRPDDPVPADPQSWLRAQLGRDDPTAPVGRPTTGDRLAILARVIEAARAQKQAGAAAVDMQDNPDVHLLREGFRQETHDILGDALMTQAPFRERLVWFWANHFTVAARDRIILAVAGPYIREAIRPHVTGNFRDMLLAVMRHPAMLAYLDQMRSAGPSSQAGIAHKAGLNENLARECLELHTVTPASFYTQADVTAFAKVLTGWSVALKEAPLGFRYRERAHEPGEQVVMGRRWPDGEEGGIALLTWLANHPSTHRHLAEKLVRHFVTDEPPPDQVRIIEGVLRDTNGDLGTASAALITLPGAWSPLTKLRAPQDYVVAALRATGAHPDTVPNLAGFAGGLGQPVLQAPFPIGWPDRAADWANPEAMLQRVDFAYGLAGRNASLDPMQLGQATLGPLLGQDTMAQLRAAGSRRDALTLLIASPEFQRR